MPRKKSMENITENNFVYCGLIKCPHKYCLRHHDNEPWDKLIYERKFNPDKDWNCKDIVED